MKTHCKWKRSLAALLLASVGALPVGAQQQIQNRGVPIDLKMTIDETLTPGDGCAQFNVRYTVIGLSPQFGAFSAASSHCATLDQAGYFSVPSGEMTLKNDAGDMLTVAYSLNLVPTQGQSVYALTGLLRVTGGGGRYSGATGSGVALGYNYVNQQANRYTPALVDAHAIVSY